jgi:Iap family predicted aminopeptidase
MKSDRVAWTDALTTAVEPVRANKYHARKCTVDGIRFDSMREAKRYQELRLLVQAGVIRGLTLQPEYKIWVTNRWTGEFVHIGRYRADFWYIGATDAVVIEDAKSPATRTTAYRLRKRLVEAIHGVTIREV